jgi:S1-C subfamily serine protease
MSRNSMIARLLVVVILVASALSFSAPTLADPADIAAASRGVVRVVIIQSNGTEAQLIGHGTGFAVTPTLIVTNAHVVEGLQQDDTLIAGVVPPEGRSGFPARVVAYSPGNDLALLQIAGSGTIAPLTLFPGLAQDSEEVFAVGYPGNVDLAQGLKMSDLVSPQAAVKTRGYVSGGRTSRSFDTILHTAPIGAGNSGGPLLDSCGRVLGVNSFGTVSDNGTDSAFYFAISMRELAAFLKKSGVTAHTSGLPCRSISDLDRADSERAVGDQARLTAQAQGKAEQNRAALEQARREAELAIIDERDNGMALAALLLVTALAAGGFAFLSEQRGDRRRARQAAIAAIVILIGTVLAWFLRPSLSRIEQRAKDSLAEVDTGASGGAVVAENGAGRMICVLDPDRSRVTVSDITDVPLEWSEGGCVNGRTQYGLASDGWSRILVPGGEDTISVNSYDPATRSYTVERYLMGLDTMTQARAERAKVKAPSCGAPESAARQLGEGQQAIKALLPSEPNERMRYKCQPAP